MTDAQHPVGPPEASEAEQVASAILDGEATPAELARAEEPAVVAALEAQRRVAAAVADPVPLDDAGRERAIAAALAAWDAGPGRVAPAAAVDDLAARRARRAARTLPLLGAAAAVAVAVVVGALALSGDDRDDGADVAASVADSAETAEEAGGGEGAADGDSAATAEALLSAHLGDFTDLGELVAAAATSADQTRTSAGIGTTRDDSRDETIAAPGAADTGAAAAPCPVPPPPAGAVVTTATATLEGRAVVVTVVDVADGTVIQVVDAATCDVVYEGPAA